MSTAFVCALVGWRQWITRYGGNTAQLDQRVLCRQHADDIKSRWTKRAHR